MQVTRHNIPIGTKNFQTRQIDGEDRKPDEKLSREYWHSAYEVSLHSQGGEISGDGKIKAPPQSTILIPRSRGKSGIKHNNLGSGNKYFKIKAEDG